MTELAVCTAAGSLTTVGQTAIGNVFGDSLKNGTKALIQANMESDTEPCIRGIQTAVEYNNSVKSSRKWYDYRENFPEYREYGLY